MAGVNPLDGVNVEVDNDDEDDDVDEEDKAGDGTIGFVSLCVGSSSQESIGDVEVGAVDDDDDAEADCGEFDVGGASPFVVFTEFGICLDSLLTSFAIDWGGVVAIKSSALPAF